VVWYVLPALRDLPLVLCVVPLALCDLPLVLCDVPLALSVLLASCDGPLAPSVLLALSVLEEGTFCLEDKLLRLRTATKRLLTSKI
jgi:hypothetical protein